MKTPLPKRSAGFSLIELLVVMAIIGLLTVGARPAFDAISRAHGVSQGAYEVADLVELARSEAVTRQTYVWLGVSNTNDSGRADLCLAAVCSRDGSANLNQTNLQPLAKVVHIADVSLQDWNKLKIATQEVFTNGTPQSIATNIDGATFTVGSVPFTATTVTFTPNGEALLTGAPGPYVGYPALIDISFREAHGTTVTAQADDAAVVIDGATGTPTIVRLQ